MDVRGAQWFDVVVDLEDDRCEGRGREKDFLVVRDLADVAVQRESASSMRDRLSGWHQ